MAHIGAVVIRHTSVGIDVLCPLGHLITSWHRRRGEWAGSWIEAKIGSHQANNDWIVTCHGADPGRA
ncbi:hypothetical protein [Nocardia miyunensis]|uniref:hypothetical protein n=1 Tax=Nocardia miyunensis TaxID=282684 RepID=UPI00082973A4|nr:hypothetical protein [Nocardia miyunensis]